MSIAFPSTFSQHAAEVETWYKTVTELAEKWKGAMITNDTGTQPCRLAPIYPIGPAQGNYWWPLPAEIRELKAAVEHLAAAGLTYDPSRKTVPGYERTLEIKV